MVLLKSRSSAGKMCDVLEWAWRILFAKFGEKILAKVYAE